MVHKRTIHPAYCSRDRSRPHRGGVGGLPEAVLRPAVGNVFETTVEQLATAIRLGVFVDGDVLPAERELAERLGVSRNTLREAIAALRDSGLVTTRRGRGGGTVVTYAAAQATAVPSPGMGSGPRQGAALADALDFRRVVEPGAAWLAAYRGVSADQRDWLLECADLTRSRATDAGGAPDRGQSLPSGGRHRVGQSDARRGSDPLAGRAE